MTEQKKSKIMGIFKNPSALIQSYNFDTTTITTTTNNLSNRILAKTRWLEEYIILINFPAICFLDIPIV